MSIVGVKRGDTVQVAGKDAVIQRIGFESVQERRVEERDYGQVRVDGMIEFFAKGVQIAGTMYYGGDLVTNPISSGKRRLSVQFFRVGGAVSSASIIGAIIEGVGQMVPFPVIGNKKVPIIEPAAAEPGSFVQYVINTATIDYSGSTGSTDESQEIALSTVSIKVTLEGFAD
jgi:hypothetical protein